MNDDIFDDLKEIQKDMIKILGEVSTLTGNQLTMNHTISDYWQPRCDVFETEEEFVILVDLAGISKEHIHVSTGEDYIKVYGERYFTPECNGLCYHSLEIESGPFQRKIYFPDILVNKDKPKVTYTDGLLQIVFKLEQQEEKIIEIE